MPKELVVYSRVRPCPFVDSARALLARHQVPYREVLIDQDETARDRVQEWTGYLSVPTLITAQPGQIHPDEPPTPIPSGKSPMGVDRGSMITEPSDRQLEAWLRRHGFIPAA